MKGDFSRDTFDPFRHFSRVLMQQGRVQLDADWNEQVSVLLHYLRALAKDINGPFWGPGFGIEPMRNGNSLTDLKILPGNYYVDGILCENEGKVRNQGGELVDTSYKIQPDFVPDKQLETDLAFIPYLVYLDVWERHLTYLETTVDPYTLNTPNIHEIALGGADTTTRSRVVWQVKIQAVSSDKDLNNLLAVPNWTSAAKEQYAKSYFSQKVTDWKLQKSRGMLKAIAKSDSTLNKEPCFASPEASYRGLENQLYRVEIHHGGAAWNEKADKDDNLETAATFKWSRDNGSIIFPVLGIADKTFTLEHLGRGATSMLKEGHWLELIDDDMVKRNETGRLAKVVGIEPDRMTVTLELPEGVTLPTHSGADCVAKHVLLRRWDHKISVSPSTNTTEKPTSHEGALLVMEGDKSWITLEDGVQICFQPALTTTTTTPHEYRTGDYWLIPARVVTQDVEWPKDGDKPKALPPHGIEHHYAPLAIIVDEKGTATPKSPWR